MFVEIKSISSEFPRRNFLKYLGRIKSCFNGNTFYAEEFKEDGVGHTYKAFPTHFCLPFLL
jgi:hypothetical protein